MSKLEGLKSLFSYGNGTLKTVHEDVKVFRKLPAFLSTHKSTSRTGIAPVSNELPGPVVG